MMTVFDIDKENSTLYQTERQWQKDFFSLRESGELSPNIYEEAMCGKQ